MNVLPLGEAASRLRADHELLLAQVADLTEAELTARYGVASGPLGDFCDSLHDLVAHVRHPPEPATPGPRALASVRPVTCNQPKDSARR